MKLGVVVRNMGPQSHPDLVQECACTAEDLGLDELWVTDHIAIPPDDAEGSGGRYLDPLATLAYLAGVTRRIGLGTAVLNLPYRPALPTAKWVATLQELSRGRLRLGVGLGWMPAEFRALGIPRSRRGAICDETLAFLRSCFASDEVEANGQRFLFLPRPECPPIFIGGDGPHALRRVVEYGDGWMPMTSDLGKLRPQIETLRTLATEAGRPEPEIVLFNVLRDGKTEQALKRARDLQALGATRLIFGFAYADEREFRARAEIVAKSVREALGTATQSR